MWIGEGDDDLEILVIEVDISDVRVRCVGGYGPHENDGIEKKKAFWERLSNEVDDATDSEAGFLLQMDGNLWVGQEVVKDDPNECNQNGRFFKTFLQKHPHLHVVNSTDLCTGVITRRRVTVKREEKAVLDFFVVCDLVLQFITKMVVDEDRHYALSNYSMVGGKSHIKYSDHNTTYVELSVNIPRIRTERTEIFNFRNTECQENFFDFPNNSS